MLWEVRIQMYKERESTEHGPEDLLCSPSPSSSPRVILFSESESMLIPPLVT